MTDPSTASARQALPVRIYSRTDVGKRRQRNEDSLGVMSRHGVYVVADGMGGVDGGDFCSRLVVDRLAGVFEDLDPDDICYAETLDLVEDSITASSAEIYEEAGRRGISGMGTTVVVMVFNLRSMKDACVLHVGDSRLYRYRQRHLESMTIDHSMAAESGIREGEMIPIFMAGVITRAVGVRPDVDIDRTPVDVAEGDRFMLCSDGLYNMVPEAQMAQILAQHEEDPAAELVNAANIAGGFDNITVILMDILGDVKPSAPSESGNLDDTIT